MFRLLTLLVPLSALAISVTYRRRARQSGETIERGRETGALRAMRALVALPLFLTPVAYVAAPARMSWASFDAPLWVRLGGAGLGLAVVPLTLWVFRSIGSNISETVLTKSSHQLVTHGPYRFVRHPLYTIALLMFVSLGLMNASWLLLGLAGLAAALVLAVVVPAEEQQLIARFGDAYRRYADRTGRLVPRFGLLR